jgi:hypothetical protein
MFVGKHDVFGLEYEVLTDRALEVQPEYDADMYTTTYVEPVSLPIYCLE